VGRGTVGDRGPAGGRAASAIPVVVAGDDAQSLPFPDDRFDAALCTWVLCGIPDPGRALAEVARVLRPGGTLHFVEHGLAPDPRTVTWQRRGNRINRALPGCVLDNDVASLLDASPLTVTRLTTFYEKGAPKPAGYMYEGRAVASPSPGITRRRPHPCPAGSCPPCRASLRPARSAGGRCPSRRPQVVRAG